MAAIGILVNGERQELEDRTSLAGLLERLSLPEKRIAIELNGRVVSRLEWPQTIVEEGDTVEVVHFVGGG